jgi:hypothetical protein
MNLFFMRLIVWLVRCKVTRKSLFTQHCLVYQTPKTQCLSKDQPNGNMIPFLLGRGPPEFNTPTRVPCRLCTTITDVGLLRNSNVFVGESTEFVRHQRSCRHTRNTSWVA